MASFVITGNSQTAQTLAAGENGFVGAIGSLFTETATAVTITGSSSLTVLGAVGTAEASAAVRTSGTVADISIVLGTQGSITSGLTDAIRLSISSDLDLRNAGLISGNDTGVFVQGITTGNQSAEIVNDGTIMARDTALSFGVELEAVVVSNSGTITAADPFRTAIDAGGNGFGQEGPQFRLSNTGNIIGRVAGGDSNIDNAGQILGEVSAGSLGLTNTGTITGWINSARSTIDVPSRMIT